MRCANKSYVRQYVDRVEVELLINGRIVATLIGEKAYKITNSLYVSSNYGDTLQFVDLDMFPLDHNSLVDELEEPQRDIECYD